jgi:hypothetical protein
MFLSKLNPHQWYTIGELWKRAGKPEDFQSFCSEILAYVSLGRLSSSRAEFGYGCSGPVFRLKLAGR